MTSPISKEAYNRHLARARNTGNYFVFCRSYYKIMSRLEALFIQDIINLSSSPNVKGELIDGDFWFMCKSIFLENSESAWTEKEQKMRLSSLKELGFVSIDRRGIPGVRWVCVHYQNIEKALDESEKKQADKSELKGTQQLGPKGTDCLDPNGTNSSICDKVESKEEKREKEVPASLPPRTRTLSEEFFGKNGKSPNKKKRVVPDICKEWTNQLRSFLREQRILIPVGNSTYETWSERFAELLEKAEEPRISKVLKFFCTYKNRKGFPRVHSAAQFCKIEIFNWIEGCLEKENSKPKAYWVEPNVYRAFIKTRNGEEYLDYTKEEAKEAGYRTVKE